MNDPRCANQSGNVCRVFIRNLEISEQIGIHSYEQGRPQPIRISIDLTTNDDYDADDDIAHVVDYASIGAKVRSLVNGSHTRMAETLARRVAKICLSDDRVISVRVRVEKLEVLPGAESAGAEIQRSRSF